MRIPGGAAGCVWADDFALRTIAAHQKVGFAILDEAARGSGRFVVIDPQNIMILLQRTRRQHYNLIVRRGHAHTFSRDEIDAHWAVRGEDDADEAPRAKRARRTREKKKKEK